MISQSTFVLTRDCDRSIQVIMETGDKHTPSEPLNHSLDWKEATVATGCGLST